MPNGSSTIRVSIHLPGTEARLPHVITLACGERAAPDTVSDAPAMGMLWIITLTIWQLLRRISIQGMRFT
jgi:hypothetical protein